MNLEKEGPEHSTNALLRSYIERLENLENEKKEISDSLKEVLAEAKGSGFDPKAIKQVLKLRKMDEDDRMEQEAILEIYMSALGMR